MNDENLKELKKKYDDLLKRKEELIKLKETIRKYENKKVVKEYLELKEKFLNSDSSLMEKSDDALFDKLLYKLKITGELDNIYVYLGAYKISDEIDVIHSASDIRILNDSRFDYKLYKNLEDDKLDEVVVPKEKCEEFEEKNIIIYPFTIMSREYYIMIRNTYYKDAIEEGIDKAKKKLLRREKTNYNRINKNK